MFYLLSPYHRNGHREVTNICFITCTRNNDFIDRIITHYLSGIILSHQYTG